jgi:hypothetical protein
LFIAEINSRIVKKKALIRVLSELGFTKVKEVDVKNFFTIFSFKLNKKPENISPEQISKLRNIDPYDILKPCLYKKR